MPLTAPVRVLQFSAGLGLMLGLATAAGAVETYQDENGQTVTIAHGIGTFEDLKYPADFPHLDYVNPDAPKGGEISVWSFGGFDSMHPFTIRGRAGALSSIFFESLLEGTADEIGTGYCLICETLEYPEDRSWVIFNMRPEAAFSDGAPLTAHDVVFSVNILKDKGLPDFRVVLRQQLDSVEALDDHTVKFTFAEGWPTRDLPGLVGGLPIFSQAHYEANDRDFAASSMQPLLGSGPYVLHTVVPGQRIVYARNPDYWGGDVPIMQGRSNFDRIRIEYFADFDAAFQGFTAGVYTFRQENRASLWAEGYDFPAVQRGHVVRHVLPNGNLATGQSFVMNLRRPQFQDPRVREAVQLMFNFEWSNETLFHGLYDRIHSFWENSEMAAEGLPGPEELAILEPLADLLPPGVLTDAVVRAPESGDRQLDRGNLRRASALLDEAGWDDIGGDGLRRNAQGETLRIEILNDSQSFDRIINPFVDNLRRAGIDARHTRVDSAQMTNRERSFDFDMLTDQIRMSQIPSSSLKQYFGSETADVSVFNKMGIQSPAVDALIDVVLATETRDDMIHATRALDRVLRAYRFWVPQWFNADHWVAYYDMFEHPEELPPYSLGHLDFWWFNEDKAAALRAAGAIR
ncbi:MAG: extracellular solute-binding protein [Alkalilacustris sp.]